MKIPVKYVDTTLKVKFEMFDIILTTGNSQRYKSVMLCGASLWTLSHLEQVVKHYFERGLL